MKALKCIGLALGLVALTEFAQAQDSKLPYTNNFEQAAEGKLPDGFLALDGDFTVKAEGGNKFLELPGAPLDNYGVMFGPAVKSDVVVTARINTTARGRRLSTFGVGLNGQGGFKLQVAPAKKTIELYKGDEMVGTVAFEWKSGEWTNLRLQVAKSGATWKVEGKAWQGSTEPTAPMLSYDAKEEPNEGRASIWGSPLAGTPIQFDDLVVKAVK